MKSKVASPVEYLLGFMRDTEIELSGVQNTNTSRMVNELMAMGQLILSAPDVDGWFEDSLQWPSDQGQVERNNGLVLAIQELDNLQTDISPLIPPAKANPNFTIHQ